MIISHSRKFIFIHLEKCGGTSVETALQPYLQWDDLILGSTHFGEKLQSLYFNRYGIETVKSTMLWKHSDAKDIFHYVGQDIWDEYTKICVVRNPIDLIKSLYWFSQTVIALHTEKQDKKFWSHMVKNNEWKEGWPYGEDYIRSYIVSYVNNSKFSGFVTHILENNPSCVHPQISRMSRAENIFDIDIVVDLTQLDRSWNNILNTIKIDEPVQLKKMNISNKKNTIERNPRMTGMIKDHFAEDYKIIPEITGVPWP